MKPVVWERSIVHGADLEIDYASLPEGEPLFAYVDDTGAGAEPLFGLEAAGRTVVRDQPEYMWLSGDRDCALFRVTDEGRKVGRAVLRSLGVGEFCLELYHIRPGQAAERIYHADYVFK